MMTLGLTLPNSPQTSTARSELRSPRRRWDHRRAIPGLDRRPGLVNQVRFIASATCDNRNTPVLDLMGQISSGQRWGLGTIADTHFKGGWGPMESGGYLVRQLGIVPTAHGQLAVAIAAQPLSGSFSEGAADLSTLAGRLSKHLDDLPAGAWPAATP
jgi:hypothetical protein